MKTQVTILAALMILVALSSTLDMVTVTEAQVNCIDSCTTGCVKPTREYFLLSLPYHPFRSILFNILYFQQKRRSDATTNATKSATEVKLLKYIVKLSTGPVGDTSFITNRLVKVVGCVLIYHVTYQYFLSMKLINTVFVYYDRELMFLFCNWMNQRGTRTWHWCTFVIAGGKGGSETGA